MITVSLGGTIRRFDGPSARAAADAFINGTRQAPRPKPPAPPKGQAPRCAIEAASRIAAERRKAHHQAVLTYLPPFGGPGRSATDVADMLGMGDKYTYSLLKELADIQAIAQTRGGKGGKRWFTLPPTDVEPQP